MRGARPDGAAHRRPERDVAAADPDRAQVDELVDVLGAFIKAVADELAREGRAPELMHGPCGQDSRC